ncbi:hypothetical protein [Terrimonas alba]|uniref:hypothetical protein n=1 Tax=Terrimonas alba TaxID=3349636 RepID=UPI0035F4DF56
MKKWLIGLISLLFLFSIGTYFFIPKKISITRTVYANANQAGLFRFLSEEKNWERWWPGKASDQEKDSVLEFGGYKFKLDNIRYNALTIIIQANQQLDTSIIHMMPIGPDSSKIVWNALFNTGNNPFLKINQYLKAKKLRNGLDMILDTLQSFISNNKNIYGLDIKKEQVEIEYVVSTKKIFSKYPETEAIYEMINSIKKYISQSHGMEEGYPMVNITSQDSAGYLAQVGVPVDREIPQKDQFFLKRLLKNGNILVAEMKGGRNASDSAMKKMELFAGDHKLFNIALPFLSLITDRTKEKDSSKWVTKIYYPVN